MNNFVRLKYISKWTAILVLITSQTTLCYAAEKQVAIDLKNYKEISQIRLEGTRDILAKDIQLLTERLDIQDKRIDAQNSHIDQSLSLLAIALSILGIVIPVAGVAGYFSVTRKAQRSAKEAADQWFELNSASLHADIENLKRQFETQGKAAIEAAKEGIQNSMNSVSTDQLHITEEEAKALANAANAAVHKPEAEYSYDDWNNRAFESYRQGDMQGAVWFWNNAAASAELPKQRAQAMLNAGAALLKLKRFDESLRAYSSIFTENKISQNEFSSIEIAAIEGMATSLKLMGRLEEALSKYDWLFHGLGDYAPPGISPYIASALINKASIHESLHNYTEAANTYRSVIDRFGTDESPSVLPLVSSAKIRLENLPTTNAQDA